MVRGVLVASLTAALLFVGAATVAESSPPPMTFTATLYDVGQPDYQVVDYAVQVKGLGNADLAVRHECIPGSEWTNRLYWSGHGKDRVGHWTIRVPVGSTCTGVVVDLDQGSPPAYAEVSEPVTYSVP